MKTLVMVILLVVAATVLCHWSDMECSANAPTNFDVQKSQNEALERTIAKHIERLRQIDEGLAKAMSLHHQIEELPKVR